MTRREEMLRKVLAAMVVFMFFNLKKVDASEKVYDFLKTKGNLAKSDLAFQEIGGLFTNHEMSLNSVFIFTAIIVLTFAVSVNYLIKKSRHRKALGNLKGNWDEEMDRLTIKKMELPLTKNTYDFLDEDRDRFLKLIRVFKNASKGQFWKSFEFYFSKAHKSFFLKLEQRYKKLTPSEKRLCAFIKMKLSTKEIADLTFRSEQAIKKQRSRLRLKLGISDNKTGLNSFLDTL